MNKLLVAALIAAIASPAFAVPKREYGRNQDGVAGTTQDQGGYQWFQEANGTLSVVCEGKCLLAGYIRTTGATTSEILFRESNLGGGTRTLPKINFSVDSWAGQFLPLYLYTTVGWAIDLIQANDEAVTVLYLDLD